MNPLSSSVAVPVSFAELQAAVADIRTSGQVGEPVNVRLHCDIADDSVELSNAILAAATLADAALALTETRWTVRQDASGRLLNVLGVDNCGRTALLTASRTAVDRLALTVFGNHGVARIEDAQLADDLPCDVEHDHVWETSLRAALRG